MTVYKTGDWVTVRCQVISAWTNDMNAERVALVPEGLTQARQFNLDAKKVIGKTDSPVPPEPDRTSILKTGKGSLYTYVEASRYYGPGWALAKESKTFDWPTFYREFGPVAVFKPAESI